MKVSEWVLSEASPRLQPDSKPTVEMAQEKRDVLRIEGLLFEEDDPKVNSKTPMIELSLLPVLKGEKKPRDVAPLVLRIPVSWILEPSHFEVML